MPRTLRRELWAFGKKRQNAGLTPPLLPVVNSVKSHPTYGENSDLYRAMGYVTTTDRATGLTRKGATEQPVPEPAPATL